VIRPIALTDKGEHVPVGRNGQFHRGPC
jgi:hypothetical protein